MIDEHSYVSCMFGHYRPRCEGSQPFLEIEYVFTLAVLGYDLSLTHQVARIHSHDFIFADVSRGPDSPSFVLDILNITWKD